MRLATLALVVVSGALLVPGALAGKPDRERVPIGITAELPAGLACAEDVAPDGVAITLVGGNSAETLFDNGRYLHTGSHVVEVTNIATGASVVLDLKGSIADVPRAVGSETRASGVTAFVLFPGDAGPGDVDTGRIYLFTGNVRITTDEWGAYVSFESTGRPPVDVCAQIA
jgi:hypothetical protein